MAELEADRPGSSPAPGGGDGDGGRAPWGRLILLAALGALLAALPAILAWWSTGEPRYAADGDELLYRAWSRGAALRGAWRLEDAVHRDGGPMMHPWLLFVPPARLAYALGLDMDGAAILWRVLAGAGIALGLYAALRPALRGPGLALGAAAFLLCDAGFPFGQVAARQAALTVAVLRHRDAYLFATVPQVMAHLRVVTPGLAIPFLLAHYALALRARVAGGAWRAAWAAASFGLLFYAYFYFATVVAAGAALAFALDRGGRRLYATILIGGTALGVPGLVLNYLAKAGTPPDWLLRTDKFAPVGHFSELLLPKSVILILAALGLIIFARRRELIYLWCCAVAALAWANEQVVTGLAIENFHWQQTEFLTCSLLTALVVAPWLAGRGGSRWRAAALGLVLAGQVGLGFWLRGLEATRPRETRHLAEGREPGPARCPGPGAAGGGGRRRRSGVPVPDGGGSGGRLPPLVPPRRVQLAGDRSGAG